MVSSALVSFAVSSPAGLASSSSGCSSASAVGLALSFSGSGRFVRCAAVRRAAAAAGLPGVLFVAPGLLVLVVGSLSAAAAFGRARPWLRAAGVPSLRAAALSAACAGCVRWSVRASARSVSGAVLVALLPSAAVAAAFACCWASRLPVVCRGAVVRGRSVSLPVPLSALLG